MFETFSKRAQKVITVARHQAGERGADSMDVNDLVIALIIEDQDPDVKILFVGLPGVILPERAGKEREPFFPPEVAADVLAKLKGILPRSKSVPRNAEMPISPELERALLAAKDLSNECHRNEVHPLHLLAASFREPCEATRLMCEAGITKEQALGSEP